jgi:hypothetical protein
MPPTLLSAAQKQYLSVTAWAVKIAGLGSAVRTEIASRRPSNCALQIVDIPNQSRVCFFNQVYKRTVLYTVTGFLKSRDSCRL